MTTGDKIREARKKRGLTQVELAEAVGLRQSAVSMIESGRMEPSLATLNSLAAALRTRPAKLL